jgi:protein involved in polysaccharide export with SLBB domain
MLNRVFGKIELTMNTNKTSTAGLIKAATLAGCAVLLAFCVTACDTTSTGKSPAVAPASTAPAAAASADQAASMSKPLVLQEGDTIKISFPGAPNLDTIQAIRRDGKITLAQIGEYDAAGKSPAVVEADLKKLYGSQLVNSDCTVTVQSSAFVIYVMGAVARPGKIISERPLNLLEALIEAGIDNNRSNLKKVWVIRTDSAGHTQKTMLNVRGVLHDKDGQIPSFSLKPYDVINVPERFSLF